MSDLRTRIANVVHQYSVPISMAEVVADAVIRELENSRPSCGCQPIFDNTRLEP